MVKVNEREVAWKCLCKIIVEKQFSNIVLKNCVQNTPLVTQLVYGTLRNYRLCRYCWSKYIDKMPNNKVSILLDMAVYELLLLNKPEYATVNEAVTIVAKNNGGNYRGLVNALLHKVNKKDMENLPLEVITSHPDWLVAMWKKQYGEEKCREICYADLRDGRVTLRVNTLLTDREGLLKDDLFSAGKVENSLYYQGNVLETAYFKENKVIIQSFSSQLAVETLKVKDNSEVLDLCAAPGSKSIQIAMDMHNTGRVVANDIYSFRCKMIEENAQKYGLNNIETCCHDGREIFEYYKEHSFDYVLLDAPCSGLGTLRHKPEIKITTVGKDIDDLIVLQRQLLQSAALMLKKGGFLLYSTCTLNKKENEKQVEQFLLANSNFRLISSRTIFPGEYDSDGFYVAKMQCI
ncbi:MAG: 16S rRNA (cytosine(967)-C(5))-methyltransferase RsmB [Erysipelotrichia bacterium]|nr:16S rRNA (cytosine(967)-C(5))-methyltransferase RsmB [Erysipelotrichia bacterium]